MPLTNRFYKIRVNGRERLQCTYQGSLVHSYDCDNLHLQCIETREMSNKRRGGVKIDSNALPFSSTDSETEEISVTVLKIAQRAELCSSLKFRLSE